jgi:hypothetical protein
VNDLEDDFREIARYDWLVSKTGQQLHSAGRYTFDPNWMAAEVTFACGRTTDMAFIPGMGDRLSAPRCDGCCDATGFPRGVGSPKNNNECRRMLGLEVAS